MQEQEYKEWTRSHAAAASFSLSSTTRLRRLSSCRLRGKRRGKPGRSRPRSQARPAGAAPAPRRRPHHRRCPYTPTFALTSTDSPANNTAYPAFHLPRSSMSYSYGNTVLPLAHKMQADNLSARGGSVFGCFADCSSCLLGYVCPCYLFGRNLRDANIFRSTLAGVLIYGLLWLSIAAVTMATCLHYWPEYMKRLRDAADAHCPETPSDGGHTTGSGSWDGGDVARAAVTEPPATDCTSAIFSVVLWFDAHLLWVQAYGLALTGVVFGYYRARIQEALGGPRQFWRSCLTHACPCTHACALCQEARALGGQTNAVDQPLIAGGYRGGYGGLQAAVVSGGF
jgi:Cys-rich protein (TIGR01571 family)